jgi:hypothetical protein
MTFRHAGALALVGWYLMFPPLSSDPTKVIEPGLALSHWRQAVAFDSAKECEDVKLKFLSLAPLPPRYKILENIPGFGFAQCVSSDDPRLKEN